jgi:hypothetical protein
MSEYNGEASPEMLPTDHLSQSVEIQPNEGLNLPIEANVEHQQRQQQQLSSQRKQ